MFDPGGKLTKQKVGTGKRLTPQKQAKMRKERERELRRKKARKGEEGDGIGEKR